MWHKFQEQTEFEAVVYRLTAQTLTRAAETWPEELPFVGFALNCSAAAGDINRRTFVDRNAAGYSTWIGSLTKSSK